MTAGMATRLGPRTLLPIVVCAAYANAFAASFQFDDWDVIVRDPRVQSLAAWWDSMPGIRPLLKLSYALSHASGLGAVGFHAVNVAIHAVNALLAYAIVRTLASRHGAGPDTDAAALESSVAGPSTASADSAARSDSAASTGSTGSTGWLALVAGLVFALHPVQTEAVTYASGRSTSLSTGLALASLLVWVRAWERSRPQPPAAASAPGRGHGPGDAVGSPTTAFDPGRVRGRDRLRNRLRPRDRAISIGLMLLALAIKESAVGVPLAIVLWVASDPGVREPWRTGLRAGAAHALALLVGLAALLALPAYRGLVGTSLATRGPVENLVAQIDAIGFLAGQLVRFDQLNADPALEAVTRLDPARALAGAAIVAVLLAALTGLRRWPLPAFAVLWTFVWLAPTNSLAARLDLVNDRQLYAALLGPALLVAWSGDALMRRGLPVRLCPVTRVLVVAGLALGLGLATHRRNEVYRNELVFWQDVTRKSPHNARGFNNLGFAWAEQCRLDEAALAWRRALALDPGLVRAAVNLRLLEEGAGQAERCAERTGLLEADPRQ